MTVRIIIILTFLGGATMARAGADDWEIICDGRGAGTTHYQWTCATRRGGLGMDCPLWTVPAAIGPQRANDDSRRSQARLEGGRGRAFARTSRRTGGGRERSSSSAWPGTARRLFDIAFAAVPFSNLAEWRSHERLARFPSSRIYRGDRTLHVARCVS